MCHVCIYDNCDRNISRTKIFFFFQKMVEDIFYFTMTTALYVLVLTMLVLSNFVDRCPKDDTPITVDQVSIPK